MAEPPWTTPARLLRPGDEIQAESWDPQVPRWFGGEALRVDSITKTVGGPMYRVDCTPVSCQSEEWRRHMHADDHVTLLSRDTPAQRAAVRAAAPPKVAKSTTKIKQPKKGQLKLF